MQSNAILRECFGSHLGTPEAFKTWLNAHDTDAIIGTARAATKCPIHNFLSEVCAVEEFTPFDAVSMEMLSYFLVGASDISVHRPGFIYSTTRLMEVPPWAAWFITLIDGEYGDSTITAGQCIEVLDRALLSFAESLQLKVGKTVAFSTVQSWDKVDAALTV